MSRSKIEVFENLYKSAFADTKKATEAVPADKRMQQAKDGKAHPLWLLGHLAFGTDFIVSGVLLGGKMVLTSEYSKMFAPDMAGGAPVTTDASAYPAWDDVVAQYGKASANTLELLKGAQDSDLAGGMKGNAPPGFEEFFKSFEGVLNTMLQHDAYHRGQMNLLAKM